jgi:hypothetical protein
VKAGYQSCSAIHKKRKTAGSFLIGRFIRKLYTKYKKNSPVVTEPSRLHKATIGLHYSDKWVAQENQAIFSRETEGFGDKKTCDQPEAVAGFID